MVGGPGADRLAAVLLRCHVSHRLCQLPKVTCGILKGAVALAVLPVYGGLNYPGPVVSSAGECRVDILNPNPDQVAVPIQLGRATVAAEIRDDHRTVISDRHLHAVVFADACALDEPER